jgi:hypothetical protein
MSKKAVPLGTLSKDHDRSSLKPDTQGQKRYNLRSQAARHLPSNDPQSDPLAHAPGESAKNHRDSPANDNSPADLAYSSPSDSDEDEPFNEENYIKRKEEEIGLRIPRDGIDEEVLAVLAEKPDPKGVKAVYDILDKSENLDSGRDYRGVKVPVQMLRSYHYYKRQRKEVRKTIILKRSIAVLNESVARLEQSAARHVRLAALQDGVRNPWIMDGWGLLDMEEE